MKSLFQGYSRSNITFTPNNWNTKKASISKPWVISYRFYDPTFKGTDKWAYLVQFRGMNDYKTLPERQEATRSAIEEELQALDEEGFNPITGACMFDASTPPEEAREIDQSTPYMVALQFALKYCQVGSDTRRDIKTVLKYYELSAMALGKHRLPLRMIKRRDIIAILDNCKTLAVTKVIKGKMVIRKKIWNNNQFNVYCRYLQILYAYLEKEDIVEYNPVSKIDKKVDLRDEDEKARTILTKEECARIKVYLRADKKLKTFHRFINIFFHSGARPVELTRVQGKDVDLIGQRFRITIKKGRKGGMRRVWKTIKDIALPYWKEATGDCRPDDFVFSVGLNPGQLAIARKYLTMRWKRHVKDALGIRADLYSLKHLHTTEVIDILESQEQSDATAQAAGHNSHNSETMVIKIYDVKRGKREHDKVKGIGNAFGG